MLNTDQNRVTKLMVSHTMLLLLMKKKLKRSQLSLKLRSGLVRKDTLFMLHGSGIAKIGPTLHTGGNPTARHNFLVWCRISRNCGGATCYSYVVSFVLRFINR